MQIFRMPAVAFIASINLFFLLQVHWYFHFLGNGTSKWYFKIECESVGVFIYCASFSFYDSMIFPGIFGTPHILQQPTHSPFTDVSINKEYFKKIFLIKVSCCWFTCKKFVFNVILPITLCNKTTQYSTQHLTYIVSFDAQYFPYSNTLFNDCKVCCSSNQCLFS